MTGDSLGPMPEAETEEPDPLPGGIDSDDDPRYGTAFGPPTTPDLPPHENPAVDDAVPDEVTAPDDKQQEPDPSTEDGEEAADEDAGTTSESEPPSEPTA